VSPRRQEASTAIAEGINIVGRGHNSVGWKRHAKGFNEQFIAGTKARQQRRVQVQEGNHRGWPGQRKFDLEFGQDKHWLSIYYRTEDPTYLIFAGFIYRVHCFLLLMDGYFLLTVALTLAFSAGMSCPECLTRPQPR
jgi:hypothetical protein